MDSGVVLLIRFSLDDTIAAVRTAACGCLAALLAYDSLEPALGVASPWAGHLRPGLASALHAKEEVRRVGVWQLC